MAKIKLSKLQSAYQEFFRAKMEEFGVKSPVELKGDDKRKEFWNSIKKEWPKAKKQIKEGVLRQTIRYIIEEQLGIPKRDGSGMGLSLNKNRGGCYDEEEIEENDEIKGGKGDKINPDDVDQKELQVGIEVELEHTNDRKVATEISLDHLKEDPQYYSKLLKSGLVDEPEAIEKAKELGLTEAKLKDK